MFRCYEIKVSKSDFYSKAKNSFVGHYNYYAMPKELYLKVKGDIPDYVGVFDGYSIIKKPKKVALKRTTTVLLSSMVRSLYREYLKKEQMDNPRMIEDFNNTINGLRNQLDSIRKTQNDLYAILNKHNIDWYEELKTIKKTKKRR